jgi:hypothetical protein
LSRTTFVQFAACFRDYRDPARVTHAVARLERQPVYGLALGYEDLNDHDTLRYNRLLVDLCVQAHASAPPTELVLDLDRRLPPLPARPHGAHRSGR